MKAKTEPKPNVKPSRINEFGTLERRLNVDVNIRSKMINEIYKSALSKLPKEEQKILKALRDNIPNIKNLGDSSKTELLCKLGLFMLDCEDRNGSM